MDKKPIELFIRQELFDHLIYPISSKLDDNLIILLFRKLHVLSEIDFKISIKEWLQRASETGLTETEANVLFQTFKVFENESETSTINSRYEAPNKNSVDVRYFGLFFALQAFAQRAKISLNIDKTDKSPFSYHASPLSSPRGKNNNSYRNQSQGLEYQFIVNFIKSNLKLFLRIIASDIHNTETSLNVSEYNTLRFLFQIYDDDMTTSKKNTLSSYTNFFENSPVSTKINMNIVSECLTSVISSSPPEQTNYIQFKDLSKCVTIKTDCTNKNIKISQCEDSYFYVNTHVINAKISHCTNCTIVIAAVSKIVSIDKCENCQICIAANFTRVSNMIDSTVYLYSVSPPVLYGDNRGLCLGPHNVYYTDLSIHVKNSKLLLNNQGIKNFSFPTFFNDKKEQVNIIQPENFNTIVLPFEAKAPVVYKYTPKAYVDAIESKHSTYSKIQMMIREAGFQEEQEKAFHIALQGYFREWLMASGNIKSMNDIVKMIDLPLLSGKNDQQSDTDS